ncbi:RNA polymerase sigma factor SigM [Streptomyces sp. ST2-7A]|uniref:RNA polymerase sigma factor SigM n=1 Tax=Streptomyces sp. ST2-7A TaxID=2907214 RepID=UPI001F1B0584|nr:RNA polymerase sigma factor SigM [Streptomyces sp. ST2-7A]MCE7081498.1 RNA polymerase sigma factor SigM [Streptomyces sp. ST2-7A]
MEPDEDLLARHVAGDPDAFAELVRRHRDRLWAVALRTLGDREEAADALQDAFVSAHRAAPSFQGRSAVTTWLHRIVVNACLDRLRRARSRRTSPLPEPERLETLLEPQEPASIPAERGEVRRELARALARLPEEQRAALVLVDLQGYPVAEAAELLGAPVGTVKSRCARGRARLLPLLRHLREDPPPDRGASTAGDGDHPRGSASSGSSPAPVRNRTSGSSVPSTRHGDSSDVVRGGGGHP